MRDIGRGPANSLICEPVVLKVRFNARTWLQVDFVQNLNPGDEDPPQGLCVAVLGPVLFSNIVDVLHCTHGRRLGQVTEPVRTFDDDGKFLASIRTLRDKLMQKRPDAWLLRHMGQLTRTVGCRLSGGEVPEVTLDDEIRRLRQAQVRA